LGPDTLCDEFAVVYAQYNMSALNTQTLDKF
jgi:hypothetical protein